ncbi:MAG: VCBS repeat-containing protein [Planctomycetota bacterium]|nr:VCBS repeat-containing protein [Planctomycetota bacterium]
MRHHTNAPFLQTVCSTAVFFLALAGCGGDDGLSVDPVDLPDAVDLGPVEDPMTVMDVVETLSEDVANRLIELASSWKRRATEEALEGFESSFAGHAPGSLVASAPTALPLGGEQVIFDLSTAQVVGRRGWMASFDVLLSEYGVIDAIEVKVKEAEFARGGSGMGRAKVKITIHGLDPGRGPRVTVLDGLVEVHQTRGMWRLFRFQVLGLVVEQREASLFSDVTLTAGLVHQEGIFGKDGNANFYWNGAASHDIDGDGLWDLFVPSTERCFLYRNSGRGSFEEVSKAWGLDKEVGGTGSVFFDYDNDGDPDLVVGHVGWTRKDGSEGGDTMRLYRNDGNRFTDVTSVSGLNGRIAAFSVIASDVDGNGFLDVYVCSYNREDVTSPNSWHQATNGIPNALYMNQGDGTFVEEAALRGVDDRRWTLAAAAADFDEDGDQDLYLANDYGDNALLMNDGTGHFQDHAEQEGVLDTGNGMSASWGDVDNDGDLDLYVANMSSTAGNRILQRLAPESDDGVWNTLVKLAAGNSLFLLEDGDFQIATADQGGLMGSWAWSSVFTDVELDGDLDLFVTNGFITGESVADT